MRAGLRDDAISDASVHRTGDRDPATRAAHAGTADGEELPPDA
ncbi:MULTISPECIES: hypothetical protein [unclassified Streptomyces]|nr:MULTISPECIES: hypothetical protein [unclassified Streptomyces]MCX5051005.1 hypothetical protein [Streptomyces sp. NBC_00474]MCX5061360.1 hypothetical protein [Streptomyces sp. NBC_00452]MCX5248893.1 hypothetical protein [Streptomyces sp. NBC_00201]MCX5293012.1 hypothetical protein [Streptomyces sp. NBC_00183]